jgi:hypothetical protein
MGLNQLTDKSAKKVSTVDDLTAGLIPPSFGHLPSPSGHAYAYPDGEGRAEPEGERGMRLHFGNRWWEILRILTLPSPKERVPNTFKVLLRGRRI